jgi:hypothetical protein
MKTLGILVALSVAGAVSAAAQNDPLKTARDLYASAAYDEALSELAQVERDRPAPAAALETDAYRAFCLIALGRSGEAETILESLVRKDPMLTVDRYPDVSPRISDQFGAVRQRLLPQLIREEYRTARASASRNAPTRGRSSPGFARCSGRRRTSTPGTRRSTTWVCSSTVSSI